MKKSLLALPAFCMLLLSACNKSEDKAVITTNYGVIKVQLYPEKAPKAVENFITHAKNGYYDGLIFHRVINGFMLQGGDPEGTGRGGESIWGKPFEDEFDASLRNYNGALSMANSGANTNGSQFFIVQNNKLDDSSKAMLKQYLENQDTVIGTKQDGTEAILKEYYPLDESVVNEYLNVGGTPHLDFKHTVFGRVYEGMDVVDKIAVVKTGANDRPKEDVVIESIEIGE